MITIVFGKPGSGKTAYMTADAVRYMNNSAECLELQRVSSAQVAELNAGYTLPTLSPVYSNYPITVPYGYGKRRVSFYVDGFHMGFANDFVPVVFLPPESRIYLAEAQRYYNSRKNKDFPEWVSRYFEEHRHYGLNIMLDVQRPGLIDVNIRELCERFVEVQQLRHQIDGAGNILRTVFLLREFPDWKTVDKYLNGDDKAGKTVAEKFEGNVFSHYKSKSYYDVFLPPSDCDFDYVVHPVGDTAAVREIAWQLYSQVAPEGFYGGKAKK